MFSADHFVVMIFAVLFSIGFIIASVHYVNKLFVNETKEVLVKFILLVFAALVGVFIVDKIIAFKIDLLDEEQNKELFELIKNLILMIFSYYFGTQKSDNKNKEGC